MIDLPQDKHYCKCEVYFSELNTSKGSFKDACSLYIYFELLMENYFQKLLNYGINVNDSF